MGGICYLLNTMGSQFTGSNKVSYWQAYAETRLNSRINQSANAMSKVVALVHTAPYLALARQLTNIAN